MPVRKPAHREDARRLCREGWSVRRIARELGVAQSSVSVWTRGVASPKASAIPRREEDVPREPPRKCSRCSRVLPASEFNRHGKRRQWWCRACFRAYYEERRAHHRARNHELRARRVREAQALVLNHLRSHACRDCGEDDIVVLELDHVGMKTADVCSLVRRAVRAERLLREIERCDVVCANCHRLRTARRAGWWRLQPGAEREWRSERHRRNVLFACAALLGSGCVDCGVGELCLLDFDHVGKKDQAVMRLASSEASLTRVRAEIRRCEVRCANCHRRRTAATRRWFRARISAGDDTPRES